MRSIFITILIWFLAVSAFADVTVIPRPNKITEQPGELKLHSKVELTGSLANAPHIKICAENIFQTVPKDSAGKQIRITIDKSGNGLAEGYTLRIKKNGIYYYNSFDNTEHPEPKK